LATGFLALLTFFFPTWIEIVTGTDPDDESGGLEVFIVVGLAVVSALLAFSAKREWRRPLIASGGAAHTADS
jgi:hypothetical protein